MQRRRGRRGGAAGCRGWRGQCLWVLLSAGAEERALRRGRRGAAGERVPIGTRGPSRECLGVKMGCKGRAARGFLEVLGMPGAAGGGEVRALPEAPEVAGRRSGCS